MKNLKVTSIKYFETRRGMGYKCKTNIKGLEIYNDGQGGDTYLDGSWNLIKPFLSTENPITEYKLENLINDFEQVKY